jgi:hypothetical protein
MRSLLLLMCLLVGSAGPVLALRCGSAVVSKGASKFEVLHKCGEPAFVDERVIYETFYVDATGRSYVGPAYPPYALLPGSQQITVPIVIEDWTYNFGPHRFLYHLRFREGALHQIDTGRYGY